MGDPVNFAVQASWAATGVGVALWLWGWLKAPTPIDKLRFYDTGVVLIFSAILVRVITQERDMSWFDWAMVVFGPIFIGAALWRLGRTSNLDKT
ncbi:hypothetical protein E4M02_10300 [Brevundimonas sp. S30B]|nr:hypothetical protein E4M01_10755 [Brevundimonas sp. MF30-B]TFW01765.1 hypothetical protein E4M02_10300 [Brevundimonas sp. S30B]